MSHKRDPLPYPEGNKVPLGSLSSGARKLCYKFEVNKLGGYFPIIEPLRLQILDRGQKNKVNAKMESETKTLHGPHKIFK